MNRTAPALPALALLLAACTAAEPVPVAGETAVTTPPPATAPAAAPVPEEGAAIGKRAPSFRLPRLAGGGESSLEEALAARAGRPLVLVLGASSCSFSNQQVREMADEGLPGPEGEGAACLAVVAGAPGEVLAVTPAAAPFPVLVDADGSVLTRYAVRATPSVVILDGRGVIAYIGDGGTLDVPTIRELAARTARGEAIDPAAVTPGGG